MSHTDLATLLPTPTQNLALKEFLETTKKLDSISTNLQCEQINLAVVPVLFVSDLKDYSELEHHFGTSTGTLTPYQEFELGILAQIKGEELRPANRHAIQMFNLEIQVTTNSEAELTYSQRNLSDASKKRNICVPLNWVAGCHASMMEI